MRRRNPRGEIVSMNPPRRIKRLSQITGAIKEVVHTKGKTRINYVTPGGKAKTCTLVPGP